MNGIVAENGKVVTDEMIADWESALERDEWPSGHNPEVGGSSPSPATMASVLIAFERL